MIRSINIEKFRCQGKVIVVNYRQQKLYLEKTKYLKRIINNVMLKLRYMVLQRRSGTESEHPKIFHLLSTLTAK